VDTTYSPPVADIERVRSRALIAGVIGLVGCGIGLLVDRDHFFRAWLVAYMLFLGIALGSLALMMIQHLSGGVWGVFRRIFEASADVIQVDWPSGTRQRIEKIGANRLVTIEEGKGAR